MTGIFITTGPESCGKTTLAIALGRHYQCPVMPEVSREYLNSRLASDPGFVYRADDLLTIARLHQQREHALLQSQHEKLVVDTDLLVILVWHKVRFGRTDPVLEKMLSTAMATTRRTYLLCSPDLPWEPDPLRENPHDRDMLFTLYREMLQQLGAVYITVRGNGDARLDSVLRSTCR